jgi:4-hydroxybenzoate polyprenyltransferase
MNDIADRFFDPKVARTRQRPLATGEATVKEALILSGVLVIFSFILILPFKSWHLIGWSAVALFLAATYPLTKRFFAVPQAYLGIAFGFGIPMAYVAQLDMIPRVAWWLLLANIFWAMAYDTEYAMVDRADDLKIGIRTSAITFGRFDVAAVMLCYALTLALIGWVGHMLQRGGVFYAGLVAAAAVALYHYTLIRRREPARCFKAFLHNNWFGACIFAGIVVDYLRQA